MSDFDKDTLGCLGGLVAIVVLLVVGSLMNGWALSTLWGWFIVPLFDVPSLSITQAIGIAIVASTFRAVNTKQQDDEDIVVLVVKTLVLTGVSSLLSVGFGWVIFQFV